MATDGNPDRTDTDNPLGPPEGPVAHAQVTMEFADDSAAAVVDAFEHYAEGGAVPCDFRTFVTNYALETVEIVFNHTDADDLRDRINAVEANQAGPVPTAPSPGTAEPSAVNRPPTDPAVIVVDGWTHLPAEIAVEQWSHGRDATISTGRYKRIDR
ncbi:MAG: hypothetical protein J07HX5_00492 [halophilic archaeon J07HX5]|jgi:hypothetical protein|nr:MAG: hypothetical protein J07HX5_00492 [halophilic archaeon J07HX5]